MPRPLFAALFVTLAVGCAKKHHDDAAPDAGVPTGAVASIGVAPAGPAETIAAAKGALTFAVIAGANADADHVTGDLDLPSTFAGVAVAWKSGFENVSDAGAVTRPAWDERFAAGILVATLTDGEAADTVTFALTVLPRDPTDEQAVAGAKAALTADFVKAGNPSLARVVSDLAMPADGAYGATLTWTSTNAAVAVSGKVTRPALSASSGASGVVSVAITKGAVSDALAFDVRVLRELPPLMITELWAGTYGDSSWIEILNTTGADIQASDYSLRVAGYVLDFSRSEVGHFADGVLAAVGMSMEVFTDQDARGYQPRGVGGGSERPASRAFRSAGGIPRSKARASRAACRQLQSRNVADGFGQGCPSAPHAGRGQPISKISFFVSVE
jgi:hypothetical protein